MKVFLINASLLVSALLTRQATQIAAEEASSFQCPSQYTLTSTGCSKWCQERPGFDPGACIYYPKGGPFECTITSIGYCATKKLPEGCGLKCLSSSFFVDDSFTLGVRGKSGSFGRSEPVQVLANLKITNVTSFKLKDYNIVDTATPIRPLSVKKKGLNSWALRSLEISNVALELEYKSLPKTLETLILQNDKLVTLSYELEHLEKLKVLSLENNELTEFPWVIFSLKSLKELYIQSNSIVPPKFSTEQLTFLKKLSNFTADFTI